MKLISVRLENFRQYFGVQEMEFSTDRRRNVTVVHGVNGAGKTALFLALNWCLYGEDVDDVREWKEKNELHRLISKEALSHVKPLGTVETSVELIFSHGDEKFRVNRTLTAIKQADGTLESFSLPTMQIAPRSSSLPGGSGAWKTVSPTLHMGKMNAILPANVRTYFLFDGEKIDNFAKPQAGDEVRYAIYNVMKLEILDRGMKHLADVAREFRSELKTVARGEIGDLIARDDTARKDKAAALARREEIDREIKAARAQIEEIDRQLGQMQNAKALQDRRTRVEGELKTLTTRREALSDQTRKFSTSNYAVLGVSAISDALGVLEQKRERGEIPSSIRQQFIKGLLDREQCICGQCLPPESTGYARLMALMTHTLPGSLEDDVLTTSGLLSKLQGSLTSGQQTLETTLREHAVTKEEIEIREEELAEVSEELKDSPHEEVSKLEKKRFDIARDMEKMHVEQGRLDERLKAVGEELERLAKEIEKADKDKTRETLLTRKMTLAQRSADAIEAMQGRFADEMRARVVRKTEEIFQNLIWKESHFQKVSLGSDYNLEVIDRYGLPSRADFSAGERQVLSLSFITAMSRVSIELAPDTEEGSPLVMDTPFGRLSSGHRNSITQYLPDLAPQLVLFVTDEELRDQALTNLQPRIGAEYQLNFDQETSCTTIVPS